MGPEALCTEDYCDCDGTAATLLTSQVSVSGIWTTNCAYTTQPATDACPVTDGGLLLPVAPTVLVGGIVSVIDVCTSRIGEGQTCSGVTTVTTVTSLTTVQV